MIHLSEEIPLRLKQSAEAMYLRPETKNLLGMIVAVKPEGGKGRKSTQGRAKAIGLPLSAF